MLIKCIFLSKHTVVFKQHSVVGDGTTPNLAAFLTGHPLSELPEGRKSASGAKVLDDWPLIWKDMHAKGYETWFQEELPSGGMWHYQMKGFREVPVKHYYRTLWLLITRMMEKEKMCTALFHFDNLKQYFRTYR